MKIKVDTQTFNMLKVNVNNILLMENHLYCITELESIVEEKEIVKPKTWLRDAKTTKVKNLYITKMVVESVHKEGKFVGALTDEACETFVMFYNVYKLRQNWLDMKQQIELFGNMVVKKPVPTETK